MHKQDRTRDKYLYNTHQLKYATPSPQLCVLKLTYALFTGYQGCRVTVVSPQRVYTDHLHKTIYSGKATVSAKG